MENDNSTEIKKVEYEAYCEAKREMLSELEKFSAELFGAKGGRYVEIYTDYGYRQPITSEVNWSSIGSRPAEEAVKFAQLLTKAANLANSFKYNGYKVYYAEDYSSIKKKA